MSWIFTATKHRQKEAAENQDKEKGIRQATNINIYEYKCDSSLHFYNNNS